MPLFRFLNIFSGKNRFRMRHGKVRAQEAFPNEKNHPFRADRGDRSGNSIACCHTVQQLSEQYEAGCRWRTANSAMAQLLISSSSQ